MAKIVKIFKSYRDQLLHLAKLYGIVEIKSYARSAKRLTTNQLELLLIKNQIKLPINRSSDKAIAKQELKENSIRKIRSEANELLKKEVKDKKIGEDECKNLEKKIQDLTDTQTLELENRLKEKEKEIMTL